MKTLEAPYPVKVHDANPNATANLITMLLNQNLENFPGRSKIARRTRRSVAVNVSESDVTATIVFDRDQAVVVNGVANHPGVIIKASMRQIRDVSKLKMKAGGLIPVGFVGKRGRSVVRQILRRQLVVKGLLRHPITALRFIALISVAK